MSETLTLRDWGRGVFIELQVLYALVLRETRTRFGETQLGYLWALIQPMFYIGPMLLMFEFMGRRVPAGMTAVGFLATGMIPFLMFRSCMGKVLAAINSNKGLLFYPQVRPYSLMIARTLLESSTWISIFVVILGAECLWLGVFPADDPLRVLLGLGLTAALGGSLGACLCSLNVMSNVVERASSGLTRPLFWFSGIFFSVDELPPAVAEIFLYNPLLHTITMIRDGWFVSHESALIDPWYPVRWIVVLSFFALVLERSIRGRERE